VSADLTASLADPTTIVRTPRVCVLAATPLLTVTIEAGSAAGPGVAGPEHPDVHVHPGGQGLWLARMAYSLGAEVVVCGPFGGETGTVIAHLASLENLQVRATRYNGGNGAYVHDRRNGQRQVIASMPPRRLDRHELDDLYGTVLVEALESDVCVLTGADPADVVPPGFFGRLAEDLRTAGRTVIADVSDDTARAVATGSPALLKMSHEELIAGGFSADDDARSLLDAARRLVDRGVGAVVVSHAAEPGLLVTADAVLEFAVPAVTAVDHRGAGDSMTGGIAVGVGRGMSIVDSVRLGAAAGALNVSRRGLGTGRREQIERFSDQVRVRALDTVSSHREEP